VNNDAWPSFLDKLKSHPRQAATQFASYALNHLKSCPATIMLSLSEAERDDIVQDVILHCTENKMRLLRSYHNTGRPFAVWLYFVARNKTIDHLRRKGREARFLRDTGNPGPTLRDHSEFGPERTAAVKGILARVAEELEALDQKCRILLRFAADEYRPKEIALALGLTLNHAKKISDDLRHCRRKLRDSIESKGIEISEVYRD
jgi:RNA polymerase sigma factor (sigma-70 family)